MVHCKDLCRAHYEQQRRGYELKPLLSTYHAQCSVEGCRRPLFVVRRQLCQRHYEEWRLYGRIGGPEPRECVNCGEIFTPKRRRTAVCCSERCCVENARLKKVYGITGERLRRMLADQGGACAICRDPIKRGTNGTGGLHVDHDHGSGRVRALLCHQCNIGLGNFRDNPDILVAAIAYLRR